MWRSDVTTERIRFFDGDSWELIDASWHVGDGGSFVSGANSFAAVAGADPGASLVSMQLGEMSVGYALEGAAAVTPLGVDASTLEYVDVLEGVSLQLEIEAEGVKELLVLESVDAPTEFVFPLALQGVTASLVDGAVVFKDMQGAVVAGMPPGWMADSATTEPGPAFTEGVTYSLVPDTQGGTNLVMSLDEEWLEDPARVFPVMVDPTLGGGAEFSGTYDDTYYTHNLNWNNSASDVLRFGSITASNNKERRTLLRFTLDDNFADNGSVEVLDAWMELHHATEGDYGCPDDVDIRRVWEAWDVRDAYPKWDATHTPPSTDDPNDGDSDDDDPLVVDHDCTSMAEHLIVTSDSSLEDLFQVWVDTPADNHGIELRSPDEDQDNSLRELTSVEGGGATLVEWPRFKVVWTYKPQFLQEEGVEGVDLTSPADCYPESSLLANTYDEDCRMDLYWDPSQFSASMPVVVVAHSGGWAIDYDDETDGSNPEGAFTRRRSSMWRKWADALASQGYLVANADYRQGLRAYPVLTTLPNLFHCAQVLDDFRWPFTDDEYPSPLAAPCSSDPGDGLPADFNDDLYSANANAVDDLQAVVAWLRDSPTVNSTTLDPSHVFVLGGSAGGYSAASLNFDAASTGDSAVDGVVSIGGPVLADAMEINHADRDDGFPGAVAPLQFQTWENDMANKYHDAGSGFEDDDLYGAGTFDLQRPLLAYLRDEGSDVELRARCGNGHIAEPDEPREFDHAIGEAVGFFDGLLESTPELPEEGFWFGTDGAGSDWFDEFIGQDLVEDLDSGSYQHAIGDFNGDGLDDILWFGAGDGCDSVWFGQDGETETGDVDARGTFARSDVDEVREEDALSDVTSPYSGSAPYSPAEQTNTTAVAVGDFDCDGFDDLYWFRAGSDTDAVWYGGADPNSDDHKVTGTFTRDDDDHNVTGDYDRVFVGNFDGNTNNGEPCHDIYFDETGTGDDMVLYSSSTRGSFTEKTFSADPAGTMDVLIGDFDGDGEDDILFAAAGSGGGDKVIYGETNQTFDDTYSVDVTLGYEAAVVVNENGNATDDIYFHDEATSGQTDKIWYGSTTRGSFTPHTMSSPLSGVYAIQMGDFDGDGNDDLIWHSATGTDYLLRGGTGAGMDVESLGDVVDDDRTALVGHFGTAVGESGADRSDIFWHFAVARTITAPPGESSWWWEQ